MAKKIKTILGSDGYEYPITSYELVLDENGESLKDKLQNINTGNNGNIDLTGYATQEYVDANEPAKVLSESEIITISAIDLQSIFNTETPVEARAIAEDYYQTVINYTLTNYKNKEIIIEFMNNVKKYIPKKQDGQDIYIISDECNDYSIYIVFGVGEDDEPNPDKAIIMIVYFNDNTSLITDCVIKEREIRKLNNDFLENNVTIANSLTIGVTNLTDEEKGELSFSQGKNNIASGSYSHAEGLSTTASNTASHAEGMSATASGFASHAEGSNTIASAMDSHVEGYNTKALSKYQHVQGRFNIEDTTDTYAHIVGNGTSNNARSNAHTLDWEGNAWYQGKLSQDGTPTYDNDLTTKKYVDDNKVTKTSELTNDSNFVDETYVTNAINNAQLGGSETEVDLTIYQTKADNTLNTTNKTVVGGINEIKNTVDNLEIPTKTSDLTNDSGYLTEHQSLEAYALKTDLHSHSNKSVIDTITSDMTTKWNQSIPFNDTYVSDCNAWLTNGYIKTGAGQTSNLPSACTDSDRWGILFFIAENVTQGTGTQMYFPIDGTYKGRIFTRSLTNMNQTPTVGQWNLISTFDGNYNNLTNKPTIPSRVSELANDSDFVTKKYVDENVPHYKETLMFEISGEDYTFFYYDSYFNTDALNLDETKVYIAEEGFIDDGEKYAYEFVYDKENNALMCEDGSVYIYNHKSYDGTDFIEDENSAVLTYDIKIMGLGEVNGYFKLYEIDKVELDNGCLPNDISIKNSLTIGTRMGDIGTYSVVEGENNTASAYASHAEGMFTTASAPGSHTEGYCTEASNIYSHTEGYFTIASGEASHAEGGGTIASSECQHVQGKFNIKDTTNTYAHIVGNGETDDARSNAHTLDWNGNAWYQGNVSVDGTPTKDNDLTTKKYVDDNKVTKTSELTNDSNFVTKKYVDDNLPHYNETLMFEISGEDFDTFMSDGYFNVNALNLDETKSHVLEIKFGDEELSFELAYNKETNALTDEDGYIYVYNHKSYNGTDFIEDTNSAVITLGITAYGAVDFLVGYAKLCEIDKVELDNGCLPNDISIKNSLTVGSRIGDIGMYSTAEGCNNIASGDSSHAEGDYTIASSIAQHVQGTFNIEDATGTYAHIVGNGTSHTNRSNAHTLDWDGNAWFAGNVYIDGTPTYDNDLTTKKYVDNKVADLVDSAPGTLDTLKELATALGNDANFATTVSNQIGNKVDKVEGKGLSTNDLTNELKTNYDTAYTHSQSTHAPSNAQKNSDITKAEIEAKLTGDISTHTHSQYLTEHQDLSDYALITDLHSHANKTVLDNITDTRVSNWNTAYTHSQSSHFSGNYNDLTNKPTIPSIEGLATEEYVGTAFTEVTAMIPTTTSKLTNDSGFITSIPSEYITETELEAKGYSTFSGSYNDLTNKPTIPSAYTHPSTHPASMITGLSTVATSGSYNDLTNKPTIPSKTSQLTNDSGYITSSSIPTSLPANGGNAETVDGFSIWSGTQAEYDAISSKDANTIYLIKEG